MTLLVTGASGHLGRLTVLALLARGVDPTTLVASARDTSSIEDLAALGVATAHVDYDDPGSLVRAFGGVDRLLLISGSEMGARLPQHRNVIDAAVAADISLVGYTSILKGPASSMLLSQDHVSTERHLAASGLPYVLLRNGWYLENYTGNLQTALSLGTVYGAAGNGVVDAASRADYAEAAAVVMSAKEVASGTAHELAGDSGFTMTQYAAAVSAATGRQIGYTDLPVQEYAAALVSGGVPEPVAQVLADSDRGLEAGDLRDDSSTLSRLIGRPTTSLDQALTEALAGSRTRDLED